MNTTLFSLLLACFDADKEVETDSDDDPNTEVCDGIDNDGDGLVDEMLYYQTYDNNADVGIGYAGGEVTKHIDSRIGYVEVLQDGSLEETTDMPTVKPTPLSPNRMETEINRMHISTTTWEPYTI